MIKKLLQTQPSAHREIIIEMAKLVDSVAVPQARASILWLLGEYSERVPKIAPDVLRKMAKSFTNEVNFYNNSVEELFVIITLQIRRTLWSCKWWLWLLSFVWRTPSRPNSCANMFSSWLAMTKITIWGTEPVSCGTLFSQGMLAMEAQLVSASTPRNYFWHQSLLPFQNLNSKVNLPTSRYF